ncbi:MAG: polysaccharide deacetylase family protein [Coriobacteriia bacterium]|nr:polysaccharide deacetylase family protein [Coriobacteriia bacterium]
MTHDWPLILAYHHIVTGRQSRYASSVDALERHLTSMLEDGFTPLTLEEAVATGPFGTMTATPKSFTITFDDGLLSLGTLALPILTRLGLARQTTTFIPTSFVGKDNEWRTKPTTLQRIMPWSEVEEPLLDWDGIAELAAAGVAVESHGHAHLPMNKLSYEDALDDITTSLRILGEHGYSPRYFALPFGWHSPETERALADSGLDAAVSVKWGGHNRYEIRRIPIYGTDSVFTTRLKRSGRYFDAFDTVARLAGKKRYAR